MSFKIAYDAENNFFFTDASSHLAYKAIAGHLTTARAAVKNGDFPDVNAAMAGLPLDLATHWHSGSFDSLAPVAPVDEYAATLASLVGGSREDVLSGGYVSWFWNDGPGTGLTRCRSANGLEKKLMEIMA